MTAGQQTMIDSLHLTVGGCQASKNTGKMFLLCFDTLNNNATYAYPENATPEEIFKHTQRRRKEFGIENDVKEMSDVANAI